MRTFLRSKITLLFMTCAVLLAIPAIVLADDIVNNLDGSIDADVETTSVSTGDTTTVGYFIQPQGPGVDGDPGCNLDGSSEKLVANVVSSNPGKATVSPSQVTFSGPGCGATASVTVTGVSAGTADITLTQASNNSGGTFNFATAKFSVTVSDPTPADTTAPTIDYTLTPGSPDGNNDWYKSDVTLVWNVSDPESAVTKTGCVDQNITSDQAATTYSCSASSAGGDAGPVTVTIKRDATTPTNVVGELDRAADSNGWYNHAINATFSGDDDTSGIASCSSDGAYSGPDGTGKTVTGSCTDEAGNSANGSSPTFNYDATAPDVTADADRGADHNGWYNHALTVSFSGTDTADGSGNVTCDADVPYSGPATNSHSISGSCTDDAGNSASATFGPFKYDATAPTILGSRSPSANGFGWNNGSVTVSYTCNDNLSGVDPSDCGPNQTLSSQGAGQSSTGNATDDAGNTASTTVNNINIDLTNPLVSLVGGPADGSEHYFGSVPSAPTCSASDALSGLNGACSVSGYSAAVGTHTVKAEAKDKADNTASDSHTYTVKAWTLNGFFQPVDMGTTLNTVKGGSTVPLKFEIFAGTTELTNTNAIKSFSTKAITCPDAATPVDEIEFLTTGGTSLRYDTTAGQFIQNWATPKKVGCHDVTMETQDGSKLVAHFRLR